MNPSDQIAGFYHDIGQASYLYHNTNDSLEKLTQYLTQEELLLLQKEPLKNHIRFCLNRYVARNALRRLLPAHESLPSILSSMGEPPHFYPANNYCVSISHSLNFWYAACAKVPIGVDIESTSRTSPRTIQAIKKHFVKESEEKWIQGNKLSYLQLWCAKEATIKLKHSGMFADAQYLTVLPLSESQEFLCAQDHNINQRYLIHIEIKEQFIKAVAKIWL